jgi:hypothetical protein
MAILACSETTYLSRKMIPWSTYFGVPFTDLYCKIYYYTLVTQYQFHAFIVQLLSIERAIAVAMPFRAARLLSMKRSVVALSCTFIFSSFAAFDYPMYAVSKYGQCLIRARIPVLDGIHLKDNILYVYLPFAVLISCNTIIVTNMVKSAKSRERMGGTREQRGAQIAKDRQISIICLLISVLFLLLNAPLYIWVIFNERVLILPGWEYRRTCEEAKFILIGSGVISFLIDLNACQNGYLYCLSSSSFRADVKKSIFRLGNTMKRCFALKR